MSKARNLSLLSAVEAGATADQTKADLNAIGVSGGRKNIIINGGMQVAQRGTSSAGLGADATTYLLDRWAFGTGGTAGRLTMSQDSDGPAGFANSLKLDCTTADTSIAAGEQSYLIYKFEGQDLQQLKKGTSSSESMTLSFYVKGNAAATYTAEFYDADNNRHNGQTFSVTTSWNKVTLTYVPDTTGAYNDDNALSLYLFIWIHTGTTMTSGTFASNTWSASASNTRVSASNTSFFDSTSRTLNITGVQLELGSVATDFEHRSYAENLLACQRYYEIIADGSRANDSPYFGVGQGVKSDQINWFYDFKAEKRATFTLIVPTVSNGYAAKTHSTTKSHSTLGFTSVHQSLHSIMGYMTNIGGVTEQSCWQMQLNSASAHIAVSAEL